MDSKCSVHLIVYTCISIAQYALFIDWFSLAVWLYLSSASKGRTVNWFTSGRSLTWLVVRYVPIESFSVYIWCTQSVCVSLRFLIFELHLWILVENCKVEKCKEEINLSWNCVQYTYIFQISNIKMYINELCSRWRHENWKVAPVSIDCLITFR